MRRSFLFAIFLLVACDSPSDPVGASNAPFLEEGDGERRIAGRAFAGTEAVERIAVRMDPSGVYETDARLAATKDPSWSSFTTPGGSYGFYNAPLRYDLTFTRGAEVIVFRDLAFRYLELSIGESAPAQVFRARTRLVAQPAPKPGNAVAYFVAGGEVTGFRPDAATAEAEIDLRQFTTTTTVFAVEYDATKGIGFASAWGRSDLSLSANAVVDANLNLVPLTDSPTPLVIDTKVPAGFTVDAIDVVLDFGALQSARVIAKIPSGGSVTYTPIPFARPLARAKATRADGAVSFSPAAFVDPKAGRLELELPDAPSFVDAPASATATVLARGEGVHEHLLVPASGQGTSIRVVAAQGVVTLPDVTRSGLPAPRGKYLWSVTRWPDLVLPDNLAGREVRALSANAKTPPRPIDLP
ncbi:MAG: hypothetical protein JST00_47840 [Deltaproteobacteria bacterium]|nr:hypothetical protein [Deltaproteobacteria bacterium]